MNNSGTPYTSAVTTCIKTLMEQGTDRYGEVHTPQLVSILDVETRTCPENPEALDEYFRVTRRGRRFAAWIKMTPPGTVETEDTWYRAYSEGPGRKGTYAGKYGRTISFLLQLHAVTGETHYLDDARTLADTAMAKLYHKGLFRGHPAKPYYEAIDGVGHLLHALLDLGRILKDPKATSNHRSTEKAL